MADDDLPDADQALAATRGVEPGVGYRNGQATASRSAELESQGEVCLHVNTGECGDVFVDPPGVLIGAYEEADLCYEAGQLLHIEVRWDDPCVVLGGWGAEGIDIDPYAIDPYAEVADVEIHTDASLNPIWELDDGPGFEVPELDELTREGQLGLTGMRERVRLFDGEMSIESSPGRGTTVIFRLPNPQSV